MKKPIGTRRALLITSITDPSLIRHIGPVSQRVYCPGHGTEGYELLQSGSGPLEVLGDYRPESMIHAEVINVPVFSKDDVMERVSEAADRYLNSKATQTREEIISDARSFV